MDESNWLPSPLAAQRIAKRRSTYYIALNLWPFVGILVALLIVFMVGSAGPSHYSRWSRVDLPRVAHAILQPSANREDAVRIAITRDGNVFCNDRQVQIGDLSTAIQSAMQPSSERKIFIAVDGRAKYGDVKAAIDQIQHAGITQVCFLAQNGGSPKGLR